MTDELVPGRRLGRYELVCPVGQGGMATVWLARLVGTRGFHKPVAIKVMLPSIREDADAERMFQNEAALASRIRHPNVVEILDFGEDSGVLYLVMEWVHGEPLSQVVNGAAKQGGMPLPIAVKIVSQVCAGLHAAHELRGDDGKPLGLVHRDVSPQNVLIGFNGVVTLVDFGIAKVTAEADLTQGGVLKGKIAYMSPEQVRLQGLDRRTDVFAAGILLYLLTTGRHPFKRDEIGKTALAIASGAPAFRPSKVIAEYPESLERVVMKALAKAPEARFSTAQELVEGLRAAVPSRSLAAEEVQAYLAQLLPHRLAHHQELIRRALGVIDASQCAPRSLMTAQSSSTLRAVSVSEPTSNTVAAGELLVAGDPTRQSRRPVATAKRSRGVGLLAMAGGAAMGAVALVSLAGHGSTVEPATSAVAVAGRERPPAPPVERPAERPRDLTGIELAADGGAASAPMREPALAAQNAPRATEQKRARKTAQPSAPGTQRRPASASSMGLKDPYDE